MATDKLGRSDPDGFDQGRKAAFLLALVETGTISGAAARVGVSRMTVYDHAKNDETFRYQIDQARGEWEQSLVTAIAKAGVEGEVIERRGKKTTKPGDWRALAWLLEHSPATREAYAGIMRQKVEMGGSDELPPVQVGGQITHQLEVGPDTMARLGAVVQVLIQSGKLRLPDPGEIVDVTPPEPQ